MIDSFFNYLFGASRYLTYILVSLITIYIAMQRHFPKHTYIRSHFITICITDCFSTHLLFSKGVAKREPVLSYVYKSYEHTHFPNFGGGIIGFYLLKLFVPLISIAGIIIVTLILLISSFILLLKLHHRDVARHN